MTTPTAAYLRLRFPGVFDSATDFQLDESITAASNMIMPAAYGRLYDEAITLLSAHLAQLSKVNSIVGMQRAKAGQVEIDFNMNGLYRTSFGSMFAELQKRVPGARLPFVPDTILPPPDGTGAF